MREHSFSKPTHWFQCLHTVKLIDKCPRNCFPIKYDPQFLSLHSCAIYHLRSCKCRLQDRGVSGCQLGAARLWAALPDLNAEADTPSRVLNIRTHSCYSCLTKRSGFYTWHFHNLHILVLSFVSFINWSIVGRQKTYRKQKLFCIVFRLLLWKSSATSLQMWNGTWWGRSVSRLVFTDSFSKEESGN